MNRKLIENIAILLLAAGLVLGMSSCATVDLTDPTVTSSLETTARTAQYWIKYGANGRVDSVIAVGYFRSSPFVGQITNWRIVQLGRVSAMESAQVTKLIAVSPGFRQATWYSLPSIVRSFILGGILSGGPSTSLNVNVIALMASIDHLNKQNVKMFDADAECRMTIDYYNSMPEAMKLAHCIQVVQ